MDLISWMEGGLDPGPEPFPIPPGSVRVTPHVRIPMADGTELVGDLYLPHGQPPFPAVLERTPYGAQRCAPAGRRFARIGFLYLAVDVRGRYRSGGTFDPLTHEAGDGVACIEWLADHPLSNGDVATRGHSYGGTIQLLAAAARPRGLRAMAVGVAPGDPFDDVPFQGGAWDVGDVDWLLSLTGRTDQTDWLPPFEEEEEDDDDEEEGSDESRSPRAEREQAVEDAVRELTHLALRARPFRDLDLRLGVRSPAFREWLGHWRAEAYWCARAVLPRIGEIDVPALFLSGVWDGNGRGAPTFFHAMRRRARGEDARQGARLVIGPWTHDLEAPRTADLPAGDATAVERGALRDPLNDEVAFFDRHLRGIRRPWEARVEWFVTGANRWIAREDWDPAGAGERSLWLDAAGALAWEPPATDGAAEYDADPDDPAPYGPSAAGGEREPFDLRTSPVEGRTDVVDLVSAPLAEPLAVLGDLRAEVWWHADAPDGDLYLQVADVHPDGRAIFLTDGIRRARFREGYDREVPLAGEPVLMHVDLWHLGHVFRAGHRVMLRAQPAALDRFDVNAGTGGSLADEVACRRARHRILTGPSHPSRLVLPETGV